MARKPPRPVYLPLGGASLETPSRRPSRRPQRPKPSPPRQGEAGPSPHKRLRPRGARSPPGLRGRRARADLGTTRTRDTADPRAEPSTPVHTARRLSIRASARPAPLVRTRSTGGTGARPRATRAGPGPPRRTARMVGGETASARRPSAAAEPSAKKLVV